MPETTPVADHAVEVHASGGAAPAAAHAGFDFAAAISHHNMPYPAWEPLHGKPLLIFDLAGYAKKNLDYYQHSYPDKLAAADGAPYIGWATAKAGGEGAEPLARAMALADHKSALGSLPQSLSWLNQQIFWGSVALVLVAIALLGFARRKPDQLKPVGRIQHMLEAITLFVRDDIVRPNFKHHPEGWVPHFASIFLAILACNLIGLIPGTGTATGNIAVTAAFAITTLFCMLFFGMKEQGVAKFWINLVPVHFSTKPADLLIWLMLAGIELLGLLIKPVALAIRLFANMFAGHTVLLAFCSLGLIIHSARPDLGALAVGMSGFGVLLAFAIFFLELLVAFIQAYVFTLLTAVFIGSSMHPEH